jgi:hypothetical protein
MLNLNNIAKIESKAELFVFRFLPDDNGVFHFVNPPLESKQRLKT